ncbi:MAG: enoyl-ACP reductase [Nanoarchaeota archaeon]|nr:enoyl-ACP reductase [Nanoarchaeota archaeon]
MKFKQCVQKWMHDFAFRRRLRRMGTMKQTLDLTGKKAVVFGVATDASIGWHIAKALNDNGCRVALGYQDRVESYVLELAKHLNNPVLAKCDMMDDFQIERFFETVEKEFGTFDILVHSVAFAKKDFLQGKYYEVDRKGYNTAMEVSAFSLGNIVKACHKLLNSGASVMCMTYLGSVMAVQNYNVMGVCKAALESVTRYLAMDLGEKGIRVNAMSAGPIKTLAASGIAGFDSILNEAPKKALLKRNIDADDVANLALFLASDLSKNITGQVIYVDAGYSVNGM